MKAVKVNGIPADSNAFHPKVVFRGDFCRGIERLRFGSVDALDKTCCVLHIPGQRPRFLSCYALRGEKRSLVVRERKV